MVSGTMCNIKKKSIKRILFIICCIVVALGITGWWMMKPRAQRGQERCVLQGRDNEERRCKDRDGLCTFCVAFRKKVSEIFGGATIFSYICTPRRIKYYGLHEVQRLHW